MVAEDVLKIGAYQSILTFPPRKEAVRIGAPVRIGERVQEHKIEFLAVTGLQTVGEHSNQS